MKVTFPEDTAHYYSGRCSVGRVELVKMMQTIPVTVSCDPWKYKNAKTTVTGTVPESGTLSLTLTNECRSVVPTVAAGSHRILDICLAAGGNTLAVTAAAGTTVSVTYQEAAL